MKRQVISAICSSNVLHCMWFQESESLQLCLEGCSGIIMCKSLLSTCRSSLKLLWTDTCPFNLSIPFPSNSLLSNCFLYRGYYIVIVPLKRSRGKFIKPWESPDEMELDEVLYVFVVIFSFIKEKILLVVCD